MTCFNTDCHKAGKCVAEPNTGCRASIVATGPSDSSVQVEADCPCIGWCREYGVGAAGEQHHRDCKRWSIELGTAYLTKRELIVVGTPESDDESHNCDAMGCSSVSHVVYRAALPVAPSDERMLVDWKSETDDPLAEADAIYAEYSKTFGRYPDEFMANTVEKVRHMLFDWWAWHRERIRAALLADAPLPVAALSDADRELMEREIDALEDLTETIEMGDPHWADAKCFKAAVAAIAALRTRLLRHSEGKVE